MNHHLIISFIRGNDFKNNTKIDFSEELNLEQFVDEKIDAPTKYYLIGSINRIQVEGGNEEFLYFTRDPFNYKTWHFNRDVKTINNAPIDEIKNVGQIILLFYNNIKNKPENSGNN